MPGDTLRILTAEVFVNGQEATDYPFERVASSRMAIPVILECTVIPTYLGDAKATVTIPKGSYFALGDNSANS